MSKQRKRRQNLNSAAAPSTPKSKYHGSDSMYNTPKSHHIHDDDSDSSPYSLSISQRAIGVEVTWGEKTRSTPFKSKYVHQRRDTDSPPTTKPYVDDEPVNESPKGLFKFMLAWERRRIATQIEDDVQRISDETAGVEASNDTNASASIGGSLYSTATEQVESSVASVSDSPNFKQLLNDSVDMDLMLCSQQIEQEVCSGSKTLKEACRAEPAAPENRCEFSQTATASKGFSEFLSDNDDDLLLALDDPALSEKKLPIKSPFTRHKSIAIQPNSSTTAPFKCNTINKSEQKAVAVGQPVKKNEPSSSSSTSSSSTTTNTSVNLIRHKSMPSPIATNSAKKCSAEEIEIKRLNALAKLKLRKQRLTKK